MKLEWNADKNSLLKVTRGISFEQVSCEIENGRFLGPFAHPNRANQNIVIVTIDGYPCVVPFVKMESGGWFLKTVYRSRKIKRRLEDEK